jgi:hypothetical protein
VTASIIAVTTLAQWEYAMTFMPWWVLLLLMAAIFAQAGDIATTVMGLEQRLTEDNPTPGIVSWPVVFALKAVLWIFIGIMYVRTGPTGFYFISLVGIALVAGAYATWNNARLLK